MAWAVGLFEGEGCIGILKGCNGVSLQLQTTDKDVLEKFVSIIGLGKVTGPYRQKSFKPHYKDRWQWHLSNSRDIKPLLELWLPFLGARRNKKAIEALKVLAANKRVNKSTHCARGHLRAANTYVAPNGMTSYCRLCATINMQAHRRRRYNAPEA